MNILIYVAPVVYGKMLALAVFCRSTAYPLRIWNVDTASFGIMAQDVTISCLPDDLCSLQ
jgi:hypothetical protein